MTVGLIQQDSLLEENTVWVSVGQTLHLADEKIEVHHD